MNGIEGQSEIEGLARELALPIMRYLERVRGRPYSGRRPVAGNPDANEQRAVHLRRSLVDQDMGLFHREAGCRRLFPAPRAEGYASSN